MNNNLDSFRDKASKQSLGLSSDDIAQSIMKYIKNDSSLNPIKILDIGCGTGNLLEQLSKQFQSAKLLHGVDYTNFSSWQEHPKIKFFQHDCNLDFPEELESYDLIVSSEVIEHIENGRHFVRQLASRLNPGGKLIISTPNLESFTSLLSFYFRGYHSAFGQKDYPAHILPVAAYDLKNMINETHTLKIKNTIFIQNGRIPKSNLKWKNLFPFLKGKRFSDNYFIVSENIQK